MKFIKNTRLIVIAGYCALMLSALSGFAAMYSEMVKSSHISTDSSPEQLIGLNNTLNNLYQAEGTAVIMKSTADNALYAEYDSLMNCVFVRIDSMKTTEKDPQILSGLDSLTSLLVKKLDNFLEMIRLMAQIENNTVKEITNTVVSAFGDTDKLNNLLIDNIQNTKDTSKIITGKKGFLRRVSDVFKSNVADTLMQIKTGSFSDKAELAVPVSDTIVRYIRETGLAVEKKNAKIIRKLINRQNEFHLINEQTGVEIDQIVNSIKNAEYRNRITVLNEKNDALKKSFSLVVIIGLLALSVTVFFMSWTLKSVNAGIIYRKKIQEAKKAVDQLLASREQLIYTITHDIKAPISSMIGFLDLFSEENISRNQQYFVKNMYSSANHILNLVKNLLDFQSLEKNRPEINRLSFSPCSLVNDIYDSFRPLAQQKKLIFKCLATIRDGEKYSGDPYRIKQIVNNLISNAIKFTPENGQIILAASIEKGNIFRISVKDSGPGVSEADKNRIFEEFIRLDETKQTVEGSGLGLAISKKLSMLMGGNIELKSGKGWGADFILTVPLTPADNESMTRPAISSVKNRRILFVDDDVVQLNLLSEWMKKTGCSYACSTSSAEALKLLEKESFDVIFTDIHMPDVKGFELAEKIRRLPYSYAQTIPIIGLSADSDRMKNDSGLTDFLSKPFKGEEILAMIRKYTGQTVHVDPSAFKTFDLSRLENLLEYVSGDRPAALNMMDTFIEETENNSKLLENALNRKDVETVKQISHKMGSLMRMTAASEITSILNFFEKGEQSEEKQVTLSLLLAKQNKEMKALRNTLINL